MHTDDGALFEADAGAGSDAPAEAVTDSAKMFQMGIDGGSPEPGERGVSPEWFYKGDGTVLARPGGSLAMPAFALDGGGTPPLPMGDNLQYVPGGLPLVGEPGMFLGGRVIKGYGYPEMDERPSITVE